jgi:hypothetical protein
MYLTEAEKQDNEKIESWKGDTGGILVFVSTIPSCVYSLTETHLEDWSVLRHRRHLHHRKLSEPVAQFQRCDECSPRPNNLTTRQHFQRGTSHQRLNSDQSAIQTNSIRCQGQRIVVFQSGPQPDLRTLRNIDATMGPAV